MQLEIVEMLHQHMRLVLWQALQWPEEALLNQSGKQLAF